MDGEDAGWDLYEIRLVGWFLQAKKGCKNEGINSCKSIFIINGVGGSIWKGIYEYVSG